MAIDSNISRPLRLRTFSDGRCIWLGANVDYQSAWDMQKRMVAERSKGVLLDTLLLLEHSPVYTAGPRAPMNHVLGDLVAPLVQTDRGGQVTYHGPGQLVGYPIIDLMAKGIGPKTYVRGLESALVEALAEFGVAAHTENGLTGVWTEQGKIAAIGVKISMGVSFHGFALNVTTDLTRYVPIVPCGISDRPVTTMAQMICDGITPGMLEIRDSIALAIGRQFSITWNPTSVMESE